MICGWVCIQTHVSGICVGTYVAIAGLAHWPTFQEKGYGMHLVQLRLHRHSILPLAPHCLGTGSRQSVSGEGNMTKGNISS